MKKTSVYKVYSLWSLHKRPLLRGSPMYSFCNVSHQCPVVICHHVSVPSALVTFSHYFNVLIALLSSHITQVIRKLAKLVLGFSSLFTFSLDSGSQNSADCFGSIQTNERQKRQSESVTNCNRWLKRICGTIFTCRSR